MSWLMSSAIEGSSWASPTDPGLRVPSVLKVSAQKVVRVLTAELVRSYSASMRSPGCWEVGLLIELPVKLYWRVTVGGRGALIVEPPGAIFGSAAAICWPP